MLAPGGRLDLFAQPELGVILASLALGDDHGPFRLGFLGLDAGVIDAVGLDRQSQVELARRKCFEVGGAVDPGEGVQHATTAADLFTDLALAEALAALEQHVLDPVRNARDTRDLVASANAVPDPDAHQRALADFAQYDAQAVVE